ncbi:MAG TPA: hypothetical protein VIK93_12335 [Limnochordales bacterium]
MDLQATLTLLRERAKTDAAFRRELEQDPEGVLARETGLPLDQLRRSADELSDEALAQVAGGLPIWLPVAAALTLAAVFSKYILEQETQQAQA